MVMVLCNSHVTLQYMNQRKMKSSWELTEKGKGQDVYDAARFHIVCISIHIE